MGAPLGACCIQSSRQLGMGQDANGGCLRLSAGVAALGALHITSRPRLLTSFSQLRWRLQTAVRTVTLPTRWKADVT